MNQQDILNKISDLKGNIQHLIAKKIHRTSSDDDVEVMEDGTDNYLDDLPLTLSRDPSPGIKFYATENSQIARGAAREPARGLDKFDEDDSVDLNERRKNTELSNRFYTGGMDIEDLNH